MTPPALFRFDSGSAKPRLLMLLIGLIAIATGCSVDSRAIAPSAAESALNAPGARRDSTEEFPRNGDHPTKGSYRGEPYRPPAFTPHWSAPTLAMLFRRAPGTLPGDGEVGDVEAGIARDGVILDGTPLDGAPLDGTPPDGISNDVAPETADPDSLSATGQPAPHPYPRTRGRHVVKPHDFHVIEPYLDGMASWYGPGFHGKATANGETYNQNDLTAAHPTLPLGTMIKVRNMRNNRVVWVRVNDRGPYAKGRVLDLSKAAARRLDMLKEGTAPVNIQVLRWPNSFYANAGLRPYTQWVVQVAAYPDQKTAEEELVRMQQRFPWTDFVLDWRDGGQLSVITGPFNSKSGAHATAARLQRAGLTSLTRRYRK